MAILKWDWIRGLAGWLTEASRSDPRPRRMRGRIRGFDCLEGRALLSGLYTVNDLGDAGAGSGPVGDLRYCITAADADPGSAIQFGVSGTITLSQPLPDLDADVSINGPGASALTVQRNYASGTPAFRIFTVDSGVTASISGLTLSFGNAKNGGGIYNAGTLTVSDSAVTYNTATEVGGGGIKNVGTLTVIDSMITSNRVSYSDGADHGRGGGIDNDNQLTVINSTLEWNSVDGPSWSVPQPATGGGGGIYNGAGATATLTGDIITSNSVGRGFGGGLKNDGGTVTLDDTQITGNRKILMAAMVPDDVSGSLSSPAALVLTANQSISSPDGQYQLVMQGDGNLVEYGPGGQAIWDAGTNGHPGASAIMQGDGNLVVYSPAGTALWNSGTYGHPGASLVLDDGGTLAIIDQGTVLWSV